MTTAAEAPGHALQVVPHAVLWTRSRLPSPRGVPAASRSVVLHNMGRAALHVAVSVPSSAHFRLSIPAYAHVTEKGAHGAGVQSQRSVLALPAGGAVKVRVPVLAGWAPPGHRQAGCEGREGQMQAEAAI